jgi:hypothetical protein
MDEWGFANALHVKISPSKLFFFSIARAKQVLRFSENANSQLNVTSITSHRWLSFYPPANSTWDWVEPSPQWRHFPFFASVFVGKS